MNISDASFSLKKNPDCSKPSLFMRKSEPPTLIKKFRKLERIPLCPDKQVWFLPKTQREWGSTPENFCNISVSFTVSLEKVLPVHKLIKNCCIYEHFFSLKTCLPLSYICLKDSQSDKTRN